MQGDTIDKKLAEYITSAKSLAGACGRPSLSDWPVIWGEQTCRIFHPPEDGLVDEAYLNNHCLVNFVNVARVSAIHMLTPFFEAFHHIGDIPNDEEFAIGN